MGDRVAISFGGSRRGTTLSANAARWLLDSGLPNELHWFRDDLEYSVEDLGEDVIGVVRLDRAKQRSLLLWMRDAIDRDRQAPTDAYKLEVDLRRAIDS